MNVLIIGGNKFFGRKLAQRLLEAGEHVTLLNRGKQMDGLGAHQQLERLVCDRTDEAKMMEVLKGRTFDAVVDQVCYEAKDARAACRIFRGKTPLYLFTSTISTYNGIKTGVLKEDDYQPRGRKFEDVTLQQDYGEGKRQCETVFFDQGDFRVIAARFPIVCGTDDPTGRLLFHIERVRDGKMMQIHNIESKMTYISSHEAAHVLQFLLACGKEGPVNVGSANAISIAELLGWISNAVGKDPIVSTTDGDPSPYAPDQDFYPSVDRLKSWGFNPSQLDAWMPQLITRLTMHSH
jgi:nucleoside-diphosphate-sugar epimerase